jgi:glucose/mannose-6-phosphate isomerase
MSNSESSSLTDDEVNSLVSAIEAVRPTAQGIVESGEDAGAVDLACHDLLESCCRVCNAEVCAIFLLRGEELLLQAQLGYSTPGGSPIALGRLRQELAYTIGMVDDSRYDGITGQVASTGTEFSADSWDEIKLNPSHAGKPDRLNIWSGQRPFRSMFAVPLRSTDKTIGVLKVENKRDLLKRAGRFDEHDKFLLRILAEVFSRELRHAGFQPDRDQKSRTTELDALAQSLDSFRMRDVIAHLPRQIEIALSQVLPAIPTGPFSGAVIVGMGGSALPVDVITTAFQEHLKVPVSVARSYQLSPSVTKDHLVIASSFSGTTEETLEAIERVSPNGSNVVCVTTGGSLRDIALARGYPLVLMNIEQEPPGFQPRSAVGYFVTYLARILSAAGVMADVNAEIASVPQFLRDITLSQDAETIARWLQDRIPIIYCDDTYQAAIARTAKIKFNENSKRPAFFNALPEANHNEMIGFTRSIGKFGILYFHDPSSHPRIEKRFEVMKRVFAEGSLNHVGFMKWIIPGETKLQKIFAALAFAERCSYNLALLDGFDPTPVDMVEEFKRALLM